MIDLDFLDMKNETAENKAKEELKRKIQSCYEKGLIALEKRDIKEAVRCLEFAAERGHLESQKKLGAISMEYKHDRADDMLKWYTLAAEQGDAESQRKLAEIYYDPLFYKVYYKVGDDFKEKALKLFRLAAAQKDLEALHSLGDIYSSGFCGVTKDETKAFQLYKLAADLNHGPSLFSLGLMYEKGRGDLNIDIDEAIRLYTLAGENGYDFAHLYLSRYKEKMLKKKEELLKSE